ncbi:MAG: HAD-IA family hydrolase [Candidatus Pacebacteria bacterium]|nr:HAD-IA family hydrolase [Candidatus Paceibacterota bacterium]
MIKNIIFDLTGVIFINHKINSELINWIKLHKSEYGFYILTNNTKEVKEILDKDIFNKIFTYSDTRFLKPDKRSFKHVLKEIGCLAEDCLFIDDSEDNISSARKLNFNIILFKNNEQIFKSLKNL